MKGFEQIFSYKGFSMTRTVIASHILDIMDDSDQQENEQHGLKELLFL